MGGGTGRRATLASGRKSTSARMWVTQHRQGAYHKALWPLGILRSGDELGAFLFPCPETLAISLNPPTAGYTDTHSCCVSDSLGLNEGAWPGYRSGQ